MVITNPDHWKEAIFARGLKYTKIVEMIAAINTHLAALNIGSGNADYFPCIRSVSADGNKVRLCYENLGKTAFNRVNSSGNLYYDLVLPTNRGGKKLYITDIEIGVASADVNDFVDIIYLYGIDHTGATQKAIDVTNRTAAGTYVSNFTAVDMSSYDRVNVRIFGQLTTDGDLEISNVRLNCYYDT